MMMKRRWKKPGKPGIYKLFKLSIFDLYLNLLLWLSFWKTFISERLPCVLSSEDENVNPLLLMGY